MFMNINKHLQPLVTVNCSEFMRIISVSLSTGAKLNKLEIFYSFFWTVFFLPSENKGSKKEQRHVWLCPRNHTEGTEHELVTDHLVEKRKIGNSQAIFHIHQLHFVSYIAYVDKHVTFCNFILCFVCHVQAVAHSILNISFVGQWFNWSQICKY